MAAYGPTPLGSPESEFEERHVVGTTHPRLLLVDREPEHPVEVPRDTRFDASPGAPAAHEDPPIVGVAGEAVSTAFEFTIEIVQQDVGEQRRKADDMVLLCARDTARPLAMLHYLLGRLGLLLNETKTRIVDAWQAGFDFLGFEIRMRRSPRSGRSYPHVQPGKRAVRRIHAELSALTRRDLTPLPLSVVVGRLNRSLRGWAGYFDFHNCTKVFGEVKRHAEERLRTHLRKRHKVRIRRFGYTRFPTPVPYERYHLFKLPTTAPWKRAHALA